MHDSGEPAQIVWPCLIFRLEPTCHVLTSEDLVGLMAHASRSHTTWSCGDGDRLGICPKVAQEGLGNMDKWGMQKSAAIVHDPI